MSQAGKKSVSLKETFPKHFLSYQEVPSRVPMRTPSSELGHKIISSPVASRKNWDFRGWIRAIFFWGFLLSCWANTRLLLARKKGGEAVDRSTDSVCHVGYCSVNGGLGAVGRQGWGQGSGKCGEVGAGRQELFLTWWTLSSGTNVQLETIPVEATWRASYVLLAKPFLQHSPPESFGIQISQLVETSHRALKAKWFRTEFF